jgi:polar amino acid transport system substrate-binding protein
MLASVNQARDDAAHAQCTTNVLGTLYSGIFTFGTDQPAYPPWSMGHNPASGEGFEAAVADAVAAKMNYANQNVRWVRVPFNAALAPGPKTLDANLSEFSITEQRKGAVDFSSPYFDVTQAVVTVKSSRAAGDVEQLGIVLDKGSPLTRYLSWAVDTFRGDGTLAKLEQQSLTDAGKAPVLT